MAKSRKQMKEKEPTGTHLKGWQAISGFLGIPATTAQRWSKTGMPVKKEGRFVAADVEELRQWLGRESHMPGPAHVATSGTDVSAALRESISAMRNRKG
jgi:hypothetical protein